MGEGQRQECLGPGGGGEPFVGAHGGHAHARLDVHVTPHLALGEAVALGEPSSLLHGTEPRLQEIGPEGEDVAGLAQSVVRHRVAPEHLPVRRPQQRLVAERLVHGPPPGTEGAQPLRDEPVERPGLIAGDEPDAVALHRLQPFDYPTHGVVPGNGLEVSGCGARHGTAHAIGIV